MAQHGESEQRGGFRPRAQTSGETLALSLAEVKQLWWFLDGGIMEVDTRHHLWRSWGFCPRHTWSYALVECQIRAGLAFFGTAILYEDLTRRAARSLRHARLLPRWLIRRRLRARDSCFTCDFCKFARDDPDYVPAQERINRLDRFRERLIENRDLWEDRSCPFCFGGHGLVCRQHILLGADVPDGISSALSSLADRLHAFGWSMTWGARPATRSEEASWVEVLGWFAGWDFPRLVLDW